MSYTPTSVVEVLREIATDISARLDAALALLVKIEKNTRDKKDKD